MKQKAYQAAFPTAAVVLMAAFISAVFFTNTNLSFAGSDKTNSSGYERISAAEYTEAQIKALQDALVITEAQKELWSNLTRVMRENAKDVDVLNKDAVENNNKMTAVELTKFHSKVTESHLDQLKKFTPAFESFYGSLTEKQKAVTDSIFNSGE